MTARGVTTVVGIIGTLAYGITAIRKGKPIRVEDLFMFGLWCAAPIVGGYMVAAALGFGKADTLYVGIFGVVLILFSFQKIHSMVRALRAKTSATLVVSSSKQNGPEQR